MQAARRAGVSYSVWGLGSDIWTLGRIPLVMAHAAPSHARSYAPVRGRHPTRKRYARDSVTGMRVPAQLARFPVVKTRDIAQRAPYRLAFLGRWHPNKGTDLLLDALHQLRDDDWQRIEAVRIAGGGPLVDRVVAEVDGLRDAGRPVYREGYLALNAATELFDWADFILLPSAYRKHPRGVLRRDASGTASDLHSGRRSASTVVRYQCGVMAEQVTDGRNAAAIRKAFHRGPTEMLVGLGESRR